MAHDPAQMIEKLEAALGSGVLSIKADGEEIEYRSPAALQSALRYWKAQLSAGSGQAVSRTTYATFERD